MEQFNDDYAQSTVPNGEVNDKWITRAAAADIVSRPIETLRWWAQFGRADEDPFPQPIRVGRRVTYSKAEVQDWMPRQATRRVSPR